MKLEPVNLETIGGGVAGEMFSRELARVLKDIDDPNTKPDAVRTITLEFAIKPTENRDAAQLAVKCKSKVAGLRPGQSLLHLANHGGRLVALSKNPNQTDAFRAIDGGKKD